VFALEPDRYLIRYGGYAPQGVWSNYSAAQVFDASLTSLEKGWGEGNYSMGYRRDVDGRVYASSRDQFGALETPGPSCRSRWFAASRSRC
jgi:hypothetical protein